MPQGTGGERSHASAETGFLALGRDTLVNALPQPDVRLHVPGVQKHLQILRKLNIPYFDVGCAFPCRTATWSIASETESSLNGGSLVYSSAKMPE